MLDERNANGEGNEVHVDDFEDMGNLCGGRGVGRVGGVSLGNPPL